MTIFHKYTHFSYFEAGNCYSNSSFKWRKLGASNSAGHELTDKAQRPRRTPRSPRRLLKEPRIQRVSNQNGGGVQLKGSLTSEQRWANFWRCWFTVAKMSHSLLRREPARVISKNELRTLAPKIPVGRLWCNDGNVETRCMEFCATPCWDWFTPWSCRTMLRSCHTVLIVSHHFVIVSHHVENVSHHDQIHTVSIVSHYVEIVSYRVDMCHNMLTSCLTMLRTCHTMFRLCRTMLILRHTMFVWRWSSTLSQSWSMFD